MEFSRLNRNRVMLGAAGSVLLIVSVLFLPWYSLDAFEQRQEGVENPDTFICGQDEFSCTGFETFPILRWLLLLTAIAPLILGYIIVRGHKLSYPPGEMTMVSGFIAAVLIAYNGIVDKPGTSTGEIGISLDYGYWIALFAAIVISAVGFTRSLESGARKPRQAPGNV